ncbi:MAG: L-seryl-tRNA(Sec) selenium transferase [Candidatus Promineifilaceae bacterium]|nr:L-seryl-tRNA(Sec) selenium transferase [Candidatus Promineifilaceae bacterium]
MSSSNAQQLLRQLPSVDYLLQNTSTQDLIADFGRLLTVHALRFVLEEARENILLGSTTHLPEDEQIIYDSGVFLQRLLAPTLRPVINATGIIIHTNLGRAPLSQDAMAAVQAVSEGYSTLEYESTSGRRGSRAVHAEALLTRLTGSEQALVVNNNAAAVLLMLTVLCQGREVIISRGQLVEIGGGFRVPDVMVQSGAKLIEVGTTNRTHLPDYASAISERTAAILVAHPSNYRVVGFTAEPALGALAELAHTHEIPLLYDQGSGTLLDVTPYGLEPEPTVIDGMEAGADIIAFSGDKLLGGPQAGILCGQAELMVTLKRHPLARAIRADKLCLAALSATLTHYLKGEAAAQIPVWQMIARTSTDISAAATRWIDQLCQQNIDAFMIAGESRVGGGSLPGSSLPTKLVAINTKNAESLAEQLRGASAPVIGRIQDNLVLLDPRTVLPFQEEDLMHSLLTLCSSS